MTYEKVMATICQDLLNRKADYLFFTTSRKRGRDSLVQDFRLRFRLPIPF